PIPPVTQPVTTPIIQYLRRARIAQSSALPTVADEHASPVRDAQEEEIVKLKDVVKVLEDREGVATKQSRDDTPIKGRSINEGEAAAERIIMVESDTPKKKKLQEQINAQVARELEEQQEKEDMRINEQIARDAKVARIHVEEELQGMIDSLDKSNETTTKYLQEYQEFTSELPLEKRIELISDLVKYQEHYTKVEDFIPIGSKEESERLKRKGLNLEKEQVKKQKSSEEAPETETSTEEFIKEIMQLVPVEDMYVQALQVKHLIINWKVHSEGERSYWQIIRQTNLYASRKRLSTQKRVSTCDDQLQAQVENHSQMAEILIRKIYNIANTPRKQSD
nr:hypothetical protein [Tanacetum cinerariifolium]